MGATNQRASENIIWNVLNQSIFDDGLAGIGFMIVFLGFLFIALGMAIKIFSSLPFGLFAFVLGVFLEILGISIMPYAVFFR